MIPNNRHISEYKRVMCSIDIEESAKQQIIKNCARYSTLNKIRSGRFKIIATVKEKTGNTF